MKDKIEIIIENTEWEKRGEFTAWKVALKKNGIEQFIGFETLPSPSPEDAFSRVLKFIKPDEAPTP